MIGDVKKARNKLKDLVTEKKLKDVLKWMKSKETSGATTGTIVSKITGTLFGDEYVEKINNSGKDVGEQMVSVAMALESAAQLLSKRPHTKRGSNFCKLVNNYVYATVMGSVDMKKSLLRYLGLTNKPNDDLGKEGWVRKHKDLAAKMSGALDILDVNKLKVIVAASSVGLGDQMGAFKKKQEENERAKAAAEAKHEKEEREKAQKAEEERKAREEAERIAKAEAEKKARAEAAARQAKAEAEERAKKEAEEKAKAEKKLKIEFTAKSLAEKFGNGTLTAAQFNSLVKYISNGGDKAVLGEIEELTIPKGVRSLDMSFSGMAKLKKVTLSAYMGVDSAFFGCPNLETVVLGEGVGRISDYAFQGCKKLKNVTIPKVSDIGLGAFGYCSSLESVTIKDGVEGISDGAFRDCPKLKTITIPGSVKYVNRLSFMNCTGLESVVMKEGVQFVGEGAFHGCTKLTKIEVPKSLRSVENRAFDITAQGQVKAVAVSGGAGPKIKAEIRSQIKGE